MLWFSGLQLYRLDCSALQIYVLCIFFVHNKTCSASSLMYVLVLQSTIASYGQLVCNWAWRIILDLPRMLYVFTLTPLFNILRYLRPFQVEIVLFQVQFCFNTACVYLLVLLHWGGLPEHVPTIYISSKNKQIISNISRIVNFTAVKIVLNCLEVLT